MSRPYIFIRVREPLRSAVERQNLLYFLRTPEGLECLADAVRLARRDLAAEIDPQQLRVMTDFENELRTASARPLPEWLAV